MQVTHSSFDVLVIGAGINGLSTAYHLSHQQGLKVGVIEQFSIGHSHGSSHGFSRILRSTYTNPAYIKLAKRAKILEWPMWEKAFGCRLIYPNSRCAFGVGSSFETWINVILENHSSEDVELLEVAAARQLFPQFRFPQGSHVIRDHSSGVIAANETMGKLANSILDMQVEIFEETKVHRIDSSTSPIRLETSRGILTCERLVVTAGPWIRHLFSEINLSFCPIKQVVGYFALQGAKELYQAGQFPNWVYFGEGENNIFYGLPEFGCEGIKVAQDITIGEAEDPNERSCEINSSKVKTLVDFVSEQFVDPIDNLVRIETCFYTNTPTSDFILDLFPHDHRIVIGSACSGHAFKFAPLTGRILSELALHGKTTIAEFEEERELFALTL